MSSPADPSSSSATVDTNPPTETFEEMKKQMLQHRAEEHYIMKRHGQTIDAEMMSRRSKDNFGLPAWKAHRDEVKACIRNLENGGEHNGDEIHARVLEILRAYVRDPGPWDMYLDCLKKRGDEANRRCFKLSHANIENAVLCRRKAEVDHRKAITNHDLFVRTVDGVSDKTKTGTCAMARFFGGKPHEGGDRAKRARGNRFSRSCESTQEVHMYELISKFSQR
ncbi:uncharacterized protein MYCGRDRAFT_94736 [Zymoseptoria tritici IPO323]|uniref:Uncharacterized protein n=1 Tax=Zymoseptoria tritici (strain CBS 115943 / IPO323) TaxID=336722 RepID=F9XEV2_ZYMTI|nr:uncharacterized protein MYCGRDRAFT_94736 [Zymoseptoria tritici IPO323]EGP85839.1 hypothetical protein MYCGRDRAFT_94736 [Zymoseptoria tritici IPO323]